MVELWKNGLTTLNKLMIYCLGLFSIIEKKNIFVPSTGPSDMGEVIFQGLFFNVGGLKSYFEKKDFGSGILN